MSKSLAFPGTGLQTNLGERKYLNDVERRRFIRACNRMPAQVQLFCLLMIWSGSRISEALALTPAAIDIDAAVITLETKKRRKRGIFRQVPLPVDVARRMERHFHIRRAQRNPHLAYNPLWRWSRTTAWRHVKNAMQAARVCPSAAMPKGLRHSFGVTAFQLNIPPHLVQRWLGHASLTTTAIYGNVVGSEERKFLARMWERTTNDRQ